MTNDYVAGFRTYYTILFTVILEGTLSTDLKKLAVKPGACFAGGRLIPFPCAASVARA